jgi:hypothetical protein
MQFYRQSSKKAVTTQLDEWAARTVLRLQGWCRRRCENHFLKERQKDGRKQFCALIWRLRAYSRKGRIDACGWDRWQGKTVTKGLRCYNHVLEPCPVCEKFFACYSMQSMVEFLVFFSGKEYIVTYIHIAFYIHSWEGWTFCSAC